MKRNPDEIVNHDSLDRAPAACLGDIAGTDHVAILLALFNGAQALEAQLGSFAAQSHRNWSLLVSDDGSSDAGPDIVQRFAARRSGEVTLVAGPCRGFAQNFLSLLCRVGPHVPFAALSDQDDIWLPDKLTRALERLSTVAPGRPALYAGRTVICDARLRPRRRSPLWTLPPAFRNALVQSIAGGNTMVLNRAALDLVQETARHAQGIVAHDWWLYQIVSGAGGQVIYDPEPQVLYRQHAQNQIGANDTAWARIVRLQQLAAGRFQSWNTANIAALERSNHWLTPDARQTLAMFKSIRGAGLANRLRALRQSGVYRQTCAGNVALTAAVLLDRV